MNQIIKKMDIEEPTQINNIKIFAAIMEKTVKTDNNLLKSKMKEWIINHVRPAIDEMKKFKASVESMPMVSFVNKKNKTLEQASNLSSIIVEDFEDVQDPDYA